MTRRPISLRSVPVFAVAFAVVSVLGACNAVAPSENQQETPTQARPPMMSLPAQSYILPQDGSWTLPVDIPTGRIPSAQGTVSIEGLGDFTFDPAEVRTVRPDVFGPGHFSVFDILVDLADKGWFSMSYHYDENLATNVIDELDGRINWWYRAHYAGGWFELNAYRMDLYPYKDGTQIMLRQQTDEFMGRLYNTFADEVMRKSMNQDRIVIPEVKIGPAVYTDVPVSAHDVRSDVLRPGTITALDVLLSLADQDRIQRMKLTWYGSIGHADPVDSFFVEQIDDGDGKFDGEASPDTGGWVYESGALDFRGYQGSHINVPADVRVLVSPEYMSWYWLT
jgi:hypothetical protein